MMQFGKFLAKRNYWKSNSILTIKFKPTTETKIAASKILNTQEHNLRQSFGEKLLKNLSSDAGISQVKLKISNTRQWHKTRNGRIIFKQYGYYRPKSGYIYIQNLTAVRGQTLAAKTFLTTLLHEWLHHYDTEKLNLHSIHTKGFYLRLTNLKSLLEQKRGNSYPKL